jgi:hypothetical protein
MPQIIGTTTSDLSGNEKAYIKGLPAIWESLENVDSSIRQEMKIFYDDSWAYRYITYVELY